MIENFGKTKFCSLLFALVAVAQGFGMIHLSPEQLQAINALLGCGVAWGFRDAVAKNGVGK